MLPPVDAETELDELAAVASAHGGLLWRSHLTASGMTGRDIVRLMRTGTLRRVHRGVYRMSMAGEDRHADLLATARAVLARDPTRVITGPGALMLLGLPLFDAPPVVHVALDQRGGSSARSVIRTVAVPPREQIVVLPAGRVASPARAVLDTARLCSLTAGVVAADAALRRRMTTPDELLAVLSTMEGLRGVARSRVCRGLASPQSESPGESWSVVVMHRNGIPLPLRQEPFSDEAGFIGRVDFWWPEQRVAGEFDGRVKYGRDNPSGRAPEEVLWDEKIREDRLRARELAVVRWTASDLRGPDAWLARLRRHLGLPHP